MRTQEPTDFPAKLYCLNKQCRICEKGKHQYFTIDKRNEGPHRHTVGIVLSWAAVRGDLHLLRGSDGIGLIAELSGLI